MSAKTETIIKDLMESIKNVGKEKTSPYDSIATVTRIEDGIAWVHFEGGAKETPARLTINAKVGEQVQVRVSDGVAFLVGNASAPPTDDERAIKAENAANRATEYANIAYRAANQAVEDAQIASDAAAQAQTSADAANTAAEQAISDAATAQSSAEQAQSDATAANTAASQALSSAAAANTSANEAKTAATTANTAANNALTQLSTIEDVVGVLNWMSEHGTYVLTEDTEVVNGKLYFIRSGDGTDEDPYTYRVVPEPDEDPSEAGYYELTNIDETVTNYIKSHLALTNEGLWVVKDSEGYKFLLTNTGARVYDADGALVSTFGESILFDSSRPQKIGGDTAYVEWYDTDEDGTADSLRIVGANITIEPGDSIDEAIQNAKSDTDAAIASLSETTAEAIGEVNDRYDSLKEEVDANDEKASNEITSAQNELQAAIDAAVSQLAEAQSILDSVTTKTERFGFTSENGFVLYGQGATDNEGFKLQLAAQAINFINGTLGNAADILAYITGNTMNIENADIRKQLKFGNFAFIPRANGNMSLKYLE